VFGTASLWTPLDGTSNSGGRRCRTCDVWRRMTGFKPEHSGTDRHDIVLFVKISRLKRSTEEDAFTEGDGGEFSLLMG